MAKVRDKLSHMEILRLAAKCLQREIKDLEQSETECKARLQKECEDYIIVQLLKIQEELYSRKVKLIDLNELYEIETGNAM